MHFPLRRQILTIDSCVKNDVCHYSYWATSWSFCSHLTSSSCLFQGLIDSISRAKRNFLSSSLASCTEGVIFTLSVNEAWICTLRVQTSDIEAAKLLIIWFLLCWTSSLTISVSMTCNSLWLSRTIFFSLPSIFPFSLSLSLLERAENYHH